MHKRCTLIVARALLLVGWPLAGSKVMAFGYVYIVKQKFAERW